MTHQRDTGESRAKCLLYGTKHDLETLYVRALELLVPYKLSWYQHTEFYKLLPDKHKKQLLETRMIKIDKINSIGDGTFLIEHINSPPQNTITYSGLCPKPSGTPLSRQKKIMQTMISFE